MRLNAQEIEGYLRGLPEDVHNELRGVIKKYLLMREQGEFIPKLFPQGRGYEDRANENVCIGLGCDRSTSRGPPGSPPDRVPGSVA